jgi:hypothetical protein
MRLSAKIASIMLLMFVSMSSVMAEPFWKKLRGGDHKQQDQQSQPGQNRPDRQPRDPNSRNNYLPQPAPDPARRKGNLSPEERRELRKQIHEAGRDVYPQHP